MAAHAVLIHIDAEPGALDAVGVTLLGADRLRGHVGAKRAVRQRQAPGDIGNDASDVQRGGAGDARLAGLAGNVDAHAEPFAQPAGLRHGADAAELDGLQADAARGTVLVMVGDIGERMDAFVGADGDVARRRGDRRHAVEISAFTGCSKKSRPLPCTARA